jgi:cytochrome P450
VNASQAWDFYTPEINADPYPLMGEMRAAGRATWHDTYQAWIVPHYDDVIAICRDERNFTMKGGIVAHNFGEFALLAQDGKVHRAIRAVWSASFLKQTLEKLIPLIDAISDDLLRPVAARLQAGDTVDMAPINRTLPVEITAILLGIPEEHRPNFAQWSDDITHMTGYSLPPDHPVEIRRVKAQTEVANLLREEIAKRRKEPQDDLIGRMVASGIEEQIGEQGMVDNCRLLLVAGNETTANWFSNAMVSFARYPQAQAQIRADRSLLPAALEEVLRMEHSTHFAFRRACSDTAFVGQTHIPKGDQVIMVYGSANRDPARWEEPDSFRLDRDTQGHVGFGHSFHTCMGKDLARLEAIGYFNRYFDLVPDYRLTEVDYGISFPLRGPQRLLISQTS